MISFRSVQKQLRNNMKFHKVGCAIYGQKLIYRLELCIENPEFIKDSECLETFENEIRHKKISDGQVKVSVIKLSMEK